MRGRAIAVVGCLALLVAAAIWMLGPANDDESRHDPLLPTPTSSTVFPQRIDAGYVSSNKCAACHPNEHHSWHASYHRTMTQAATPENVVAPFDNVTLETAGQTATLKQSGDEFWVNTVDQSWEQEKFTAWAKTREDNGPDPFDSDQDPPRVDAQVVMTTGSHHFQAYWIKGKEGRELWQFPWRYHIAEKRWVHRKDVFLTPPEWRPGMWFRVWNSQCIYCHSTGPFPGEDLATGVMEETKVTELGIACEACHGPAEDHVAFHEATSLNGTAHGDRVDPIINPTKLSHKASSQICGSCHSHFNHSDPELSVHGPRFRPGKNLFHFGHLESPPSSPEILTRFWGDGANRSGGREFSGMSTSKCYTLGEMSCTSCHSMHQSNPNDQLSEAGLSAEACLQCHEEYRDEKSLTAHTHHLADSSGSDCYNCHMPHTNYALYKAIRSHRVDVPKVVPLESNARPNACNLCHLDQTQQWTAEYLEEWFDIQSPPLSTDDKKYAVGPLWALKGDAGQRVIMAWHLGWQSAREASGTVWMQWLIAQLMKDPYAAVRWIAFDSMRKDTRFENVQFDFDEDTVARNKMVDAIINEMQSLRTPAPHDAEAQLRLLLDENGGPSTDRIKELVQFRDNRMVSGVE